MPRIRTEKLILIISFIFYCSLGLLLAVKTKVIDNPAIYNNMYFSFDNSFAVNDWFSIYGRSRIFDFIHPFFKILAFPFALLFEALPLIKFPKTIFLVLLTSSMVAITIMNLYKYLNSIINLSKRRIILLLIFFSFFSTNLILGFTPESYPFSMCLLSFMLFYFSTLIQKDQKIPFKRLFLLSFIIGGITITNFVKCFIPVLFSKESFKGLAKKISVISFSFLAVYLTGRILSGLAMNHTPAESIKSIFGFREFFSNTIYNEVYITSLPISLFSYFFGDAVLFSNFSSVPLYKNEFHHQINMLPFTTWWQYVFTIILLSLMIFSVARNKKNKLVYILACFFLFDLSVPLLSKYSLYETFLHGGHWVFLMPLFAGWLYKSTNSHQGRRLLDYLMILLTGLLVVNNCYRMSEFINFAFTYYHR